MKRRVKASVLVEVNSNILEVASASPSGELDWDFFCECGRRECYEQVRLTIAAFTALRDGGLPVLAPGHRLAPVARAWMLRARHLGPW